MIERVLVVIVIAGCIIGCTPPKPDEPSIADVTCQHVVDRLRNVPEKIEDNVGNCRVDGHKVVVTLNRTFNGTTPEELQMRFNTLLSAQDSARANLNDKKAIVVLVSDRGGRLMASDEMHDPLHDK